MSKFNFKKSYPLIILAVIVVVWLVLVFSAPDFLKQWHWYLLHSDDQCICESED